MSFGQSITLKIPFNFELCLHIMFDCATKCYLGYFSFFVFFFSYHDNEHQKGLSNELKSIQHFVYLLIMGIIEVFYIQCNESNRFIEIFLSIIIIIIINSCDVSF